MLSAPLPLAAGGEGTGGVSIGLILAATLVLGVAAQWLAWRLKVPSILLLLLFGFLAGPGALYVLGEASYLDVSAVFPNAVLLPLVSLAVGLILFEGGLSLTFGEIRGVRTAVFSLVTIGALVTWVLATLAAGLILGLPWGVAALLGAILVVTGPTVIGPLLRFVRPTGSVGKVLKWEGIVIDPIGALLAVLVFEAVAAGNLADGAGTAFDFAKGAILASVIGGGLGVLAGVAFAFALRRHWCPDHLQVPVALGFAVLAFTASNLAVHEAGLFATTAMGLFLANQKQVRVGHILEFKETLVVLLIALLFVALSARLTVEELRQIDPLRAAGFLAVLILLIRPASIFASTIGPLGGKVNLKDKLFLSWMAPRGIVAAAIASVFGLSLAEQGVRGAELLVPYVFLVIVVTVAIYGLTAVWVAKRLGIANPENAGFLIAGAGPLARQVGQALQEANVEVLLVDLNYGNVQRARLAGMPTLVSNILGPQVHEAIDLTGIGRLLALTPNNEVNSLACVQYGRHFGRSNTFQLSPESRRKKDKARQKGESGEQKTKMTGDVQGRIVFEGGPTYDVLEDLIGAGAEVRRTPLTKEFTYDDWKAMYADGERSAVVLFVVDEDGAVQVNSGDNPIQPKAGQSVVALSTEPEQADVPAAHASTQGEHPVPESPEPELAESSPGAGGGGALQPAGAG